MTFTFTGVMDSFKPMGLRLTPHSDTKIRSAHLSCYIQSVSYLLECWVVLNVGNLLECLGN